MPRQARINMPGVVHHVIQRGNNQEYIFEAEPDRDFMVFLLRRAVAEDKAHIWAYVVMNNHFHLAISSKQKSLGQVMHRINTSYSLYYNSKSSRTGHVFQGRFKAIPILSEKYLFSVVRYIHQNPVKAGICSQPQDYRWSSDGQYRNLCCEFVDFSLPLANLADDWELARQSYQEYMKAEDEIDWEQFICINEETVVQKKEAQLASVLKKPNSAPFSVARILPPPKETGRKIVKPNQGKQLPSASLEEILLSTGVPALHIGAIKAGSRKRCLLPYKQDFARTAYRQGFNLQQIAHFINLSPTAIHYYLK